MHIKQGKNDREPIIQNCFQLKTHVQQHIFDSFIIVLPKIIT